MKFLQEEILKALFELESSKEKTKFKKKKKKKYNLERVSSNKLHVTTGE